MPSEDDRRSIAAVRVYNDTGITGISGLATEQAVDPNNSVITSCSNGQAGRMPRQAGDRTVGREDSNRRRLGESKDIKT